MNIKIERSESTNELLALLPISNVNINLSIGGTKILTAIVDSHGKIIWSDYFKWRTLSEEKPHLNVQQKRDWFVTQVVQEIVKASQHLNGNELEGIGISWPGPIFRNQRLIGPNVDGFKLDQVSGEESSLGGINFVEMLRKKLSESGLKCPISILNDSDAAALVAFGKEGIRDGLLLILGTGLGAGILKNGDIYFGPPDFVSRVGEIGHHLLYNRSTGHYYYYGLESRGLILTNKSDPSMMERLAGPGIAMRFLKEHPESLNLNPADYPSQLPLKLEESILRHITSKAQQGDATCIHFITQIGQEIGAALAVFFKYFANEPFIKHIKLAGSVGQFFGINVHTQTGQDLFIDAIRKTATNF